MKLRVVATAILSFTLSLAGCSDPSGGVETAPVTGTVTFNGAPLEGANVIFLPKQEGLRSASGQTDAEGKFSLLTYVNPEAQPQGAVPGDYMVTIVKKEAEVQMTPEDMKKQMTSAKKKIAAAKSLIPEKYAKPATSKLTATVSADDANDFKFELTE